MPLKTSTDSICSLNDGSAFLDLSPEQVIHPRRNTIGCMAEEKFKENKCFLPLNEVAIVEFYLSL